MRYGPEPSLLLLFVLAWPVFAQAGNEDAHHEGPDEEHASLEADRHDDDHGDDHGHGHGAIEEVVVQATRSRRTLGDEPLRVEVIVREEIEEKLLMRPGNIAMLVNETPGVRTQVTSPALGASNIRIQGLYGRYTQLLADGLPLYGGQAASIGLLQVPPTDLGQVEVIKGAASSLYGPSALGGVINLVSRRPGGAVEGEMLLNATTRGGQDLTTYLAAPLSAGFGASVTGGVHRQSDQDLDEDGWIDMPFYERANLRPRLFWDADNGASAYLTVGLMDETREGGTVPGAVVGNGEPYAQAQDTRRYDLGLRAEMPLAEELLVGVRASAMAQDHVHTFGAVIEDDQHETFLLETTLSGRVDKADWVVGLAYQADAFDSETFPAFEYEYRVPGAFAQWETDPDRNLSLSASARLDDHNVFGSQFSPRLAARYGMADWTLRATVGSGFFAPTPFVEEIEAAGLSRLEPLGDLQAETALTGALDIGYQRDGFEGNLIVFSAELDEVTRLEPFSSVPGNEPDQVRLVNAAGETRFRGAELLARYRQGPLHFTGSYVFVDATEPDPNGTGRRRVGLTPRHSAGVVAMWEEHGRGRIGIEAYYTGSQTLYDNPYRDTSKRYVHLGILGEITRGNISWFLNLENLLGVRQTREDPLPVPRRRPDGQWTVDVWTHTDGFVANGGFRWRFR